MYEIQPGDTLSPDQQEEAATLEAAFLDREAELAYHPQRQYFHLDGKGHVRKAGAHRGGIVMLCGAWHYRADDTSRAVTARDLEARRVPPCADCLRIDEARSNRRNLTTVALLGLAFLAGLYARPDEPSHLIPVNRILDATTVSSGPGCAPDHYPDFADCRILVQEWDQNGNVSLSFTISPDEPASRIFE